MKFSILGIIKGILKAYFSNITTLRPFRDRIPDIDFNDKVLYYQDYVYEPIKVPLQYLKHFHKDFITETFYNIIDSDTSYEILRYINRFMESWVVYCYYFMSWIGLIINACTLGFFVRLVYYPTVYIILPSRRPLVWIFYYSALVFINLITRFVEPYINFIYRSDYIDRIINLIYNIFLNLVYTLNLKKKLYTINQYKEKLFLLNIKNYLLRTNFLIPSFFRYEMADYSGSLFQLSQEDYEENLDYLEDETEIEEFDNFELEYYNLFDERWHLINMDIAPGHDILEMTLSKTYYNKYCRKWNEFEPSEYNYYKHILKKPSRRFEIFWKTFKRQFYILKTLKPVKYAKVDPIDDYFLHYYVLSPSKSSYMVQLSDRTKMIDDLRNNSFREFDLDLIYAKFSDPNMYKLSYLKKNLELFVIKSILHLTGPGRIISNKYTKDLNMFLGDNDGIIGPRFKDNRKMHTQGILSVTGRYYNFFSIFILKNLIFFIRSFLPLSIQLLIIYCIIDLIYSINI